MRTDLSKPIRTKHGHLPARYYESPDADQYVIAYRDAIGWFSSVFSEEAVDRWFENVPTQPRVEVRFFWWPPLGDDELSPMSFLSEDNVKVYVAKRGGHYQRVEIVEELK